MIFDELSNATFPFSLRRLGVELDGGRLEAPLSDHGIFGVPARRGLIIQDPRQRDGGGGLSALPPVNVGLISP